MAFSPDKTRKTKPGFALISALILTVVLTSMGAAVVRLGATSIRVADAQFEKLQTLYAAESGFNNLWNHLSHGEEVPERQSIEDPPSLEGTMAAGKIGYRVWMIGEYPSWTVVADGWINQDQQAFGFGGNVVEAAEAGQGGLTRLKVQLVALTTNPFTQGLSQTDGSGTIETGGGGTIPIVPIDISGFSMPDALYSTLYGGAQLPGNITHYFSRVRLDDDELIIGDNSTIYVSEDAIIDGETRIVTQGTGTVEIFVQGNLTIKSNARVVLSPGAKVVIHVGGDLTVFSWSSLEIEDDSAESEVTFYVGGDMWVHSHASVRSHTGDWTVFYIGDSLTVQDHARVGEVDEIGGIESWGNPNLVFLFATDYVEKGKPSVLFKNWSRTNGGFYCPNRAVEIEKHALVKGSFVAQDLDGVLAEVSYAGALADFELGSDLTIIQPGSWQMGE